MNIRKAILIGLLSAILTVSVSAQVEVISRSFPMQITRSDVNHLYYIQCIDRCGEWYALEDIADLYIGFALQCEALNFWKLIMTRNYGDRYNPLPCP
jgi:hypothetical protein